jgi:hypothetical protein
LIVEDNRGLVGVLRGCLRKHLAQVHGALLSLLKVKENHSQQSSELQDAMLRMERLF